MRKALNISRTEYYSGTWRGREVSFKREWSGHFFTDEECEKLCQGQSITITARSSKTNREFLTGGSLAEQTYNGISFIGFKPDFGKDSTHQHK